MLDLPALLRYSWTSSEVEEAKEASLLVAADVIYGDDLTDAFFSTVERLMSHGSEKVHTNALEQLIQYASIMSGLKHKT